MELPSPEVDWVKYRVERADARIEPLYEIACPAGRRLLDGCIGQEPLGDGAEKVVYPYGHDRVIAFMSPSFPGNHHDFSEVNMKCEYYATKLAHLLLPDHIPDVHAAGTQPPFLIVDRVIPKPQIRFMSIIHEFRNKLSSIRIDRKVGKLGFGIDTTKGNFIRGTNGKLVYVDSILNSLPKEKVLKKRIQKLDPYVRHRAARWLGELLKSKEAWG